jgi:hypothetical protein
MTVTAGTPAAQRSRGSTGGEQQTGMAEGEGQRHLPSSRVESQQLGASPCTRTMMRDAGALPWGLVPYDACRSRQRPTPGLPHLAVLRLQAFSTS